MNFDKYESEDGSICALVKIIPGVQNFWGIGIGNHGRPWACEREGPVLKKMLWKVGVYSCLSERLIEDGRDSAKRVVSETIPLKFSHLINRNDRV